MSQCDAWTIYPVNDPRLGAVIVAEDASSALALVRKKSVWPSALVVAGPHDEVFVARLARPQGPEHKRWFGRFHAPCFLCGVAGHETRSVLSFNGHLASCDRHASEAACARLLPENEVDAKSIGSRCYWCRSARGTTRDHAYPQSAGGLGEDNVVPSCYTCNQAKGATVIPGTVPEGVTDVEQARLAVCLLRMDYLSRIDAKTAVHFINHHEQPDIQ